MCISANLAVEHDNLRSSIFQGDDTKSCDNLLQEEGETGRLDHYCINNNSAYTNCET
jgi:hypothetical protein